MKRARLLLSALMLGTLALLVVPNAPVMAQSPMASPHPDILLKLGQAVLHVPLSPVLIAADPVVEAVMFWQDGCPHCHEVLENVLPPLIKHYGTQVDLLLIEVSNLDDINRLFEVAALYGIPRENVGVPFLIIGEQVLIGSGQIPAKLPGLIELYLEHGGVSRPDIPDLDAYSSVSHLTPEPDAAPAQPAGELRANGFVLFA